MADIYYSQTGLNKVIAHIEGVPAEGRKVAREVAQKASDRLEEVRATTPWVNVTDPESTGHRVEVSTTHGDVDSFVNLDGPSASAIEFGHVPSGVFGPGGRYSHIETRPPAGLYIISGAAGLSE